ncbi:MAG: hypothetical protein GYA56_01075 [Geobacteraceae bacterium]|nr:hypothetical protein [Geobacteraceae bacterium]
MMRYDVLMWCSIVSFVLAVTLYIIRNLIEFCRILFGLGSILVVVGVKMVGALIELCVNAVMDWMQSKRVHRTDYGKLVGRKLASGNYRVVAGVFSSGNHQRASKTWDEVTVDNDLRWRLERGNGTVMVDLS